MADPARRAAAGVPEGLTFHTRPQQVREMIESARQAGVPFAWFTADEEFGQNPGLRDYLEGDRIPYVIAIPKNTISTDHLGGEAAIGQRATQLAPTTGNGEPVASAQKDSGFTTGPSSHPTIPTTST
jgi:SRSO17 transposase